MFDFKKIQIRIIAYTMFLPFSIACPGVPGVHGDPIIDNTPLPPSAPVITGPNNIMIGESFLYQLYSTDPQGYPVIFQTTTPECTITSNYLRFLPTETGVVKITVTAVNSLNLKSEKTEFPVTISPPPAT